MKNLANRVQLTVATVLMACSAYALEARTLMIDIPSKPVLRALNQLGEQTGLQLVMQIDGVLGDVVSRPVRGELSPQAALDQLLADTGLQYTFVNERTVYITAAVNPDVSLDKRESVVRVAQATKPRPVQETSGESAAPGRMEEVFVTAQKRQERLQDVPLAVTAVDTDALVESSQARLQDYYSQIPGLNLTPGTQSGQILSIRGISAGSGNPTVGVTVDDVPFGSSTFLGGGAVVPDIDPGDLSHVEVLRGPQGTLYGASSVSGLLKFVTKDPSTEDFSASAQMVGTSVSNGNDLGFGIRGSVNVPLSETMALRASAFKRRDPGYIDNPSLGQEGINEADADGGRLSALWKPTENFSLKLGALLQSISGDGSSDVLPTLGDLDQAYLRGTGAYDRKVQAYSAVANVGFGEAQLTSVTGYNINEFEDSLDATFALGNSTQALFGVRGTPQLNDNRTRKFSQEVRFSAPIGRNVEWMLGGFYTDEDSKYQQTRLAKDPVTGRIAGQVSFLSFPTTFEEQALFGQLTFHVTEKLDLQMGGRQSWIDQSYRSISVNAAGVSTLVPEVSVGTEAFTYLGSARYEFTPDVMGYARISSGYRAGGPNVVTGATLAPEAYEPDKTQDYQLGVKAEFLGQTLSVDASIYYIDWKDIQLTLRDLVTLQSFTDNAGEARSSGIELLVAVMPLDGLRIAAWGAYSDAELTEGFPITSTVRGEKGDRLPFGSKESANLTIQQEFHLAGIGDGYVGGSLGYVGDRIGRFTTIARDVLPSYTKLDLSAGINLSTWSVNLFANNLTDKRGILASGTAPGTFVLIQPRLIGVSVQANF